MLKVYRIWSEGYQATGESAGAHFHGCTQASSFQEACNQFFVSEEDKKYYDPKHLTYWGCRLFDNENDARKSFG